LAEFANQTIFKNEGTRRVTIEVESKRGFAIRLSRLKPMPTDF